MLGKEKGFLAKAGCVCHPRGYIVRINRCVARFLVVLEVSINIVAKGCYLNQMHLCGQQREILFFKQELCMVKVLLVSCFVELVENAI